MQKKNKNYIVSLALGTAIYYISTHSLAVGLGLSTFAVALIVLSKFDGEEL